MKFELYTQEHDMFRDNLKKFIQKEISPHIEKWEKEKYFPNDVFKKFSDAGYLGMQYPTEYGGSGADKLMSAVFIEETAIAGSGGMAAGVNMHSMIVLHAINKFGTEAQKQKFLVPGIKGEKIGALGLTEPNAGSDLASIRTRAKVEGDHYILNGSKMFITNGCRADFVNVLAKTDPEAGYGGFTNLIVEKGMKGYAASQKLKKLGWWASDTAELVFEDVVVPKENVLGNEGEGFYNAMSNLEWERLIMSLGAVSGSEACIKNTVQYMHDRQAFGQPLSNFQVLRHRIVDLMTRVEAAKQLTYNALWLHVNGIECPKEASLSKIMACDLANDVATQCLQIFGGYGYMMEYPVQRAFRDTRIGNIGGGTSEIMKEIVGRLIGL
jgi:acyl-CoA dehydrogenase